MFGFAGNVASIENNRAAADSFLASLPMAEVVPQTYDLPVPASAEGIVINSTVNFNLVYATFEQMGVEGGYSGAMDAMCSLVSDGLLYPLLRDQYGAYGVFHGADEDGMYIISYRDPNVAQTFTVYNYVPMLLQQLQMSLDQETLDGYILSSYSYYALSSGELTGALSARVMVPVLAWPQASIDAYGALKLLHMSGAVPVLAPLEEDESQGAVQTVLHTVTDCAQRHLGIETERWSERVWASCVLESASGRPQRVDTAHGLRDPRLAGPGSAFSGVVPQLWS